MSPVCFSTANVPENGSSSKCQSGCRKLDNTTLEWLLRECQIKVLCVSNEISDKTCFPVICWKIFRQIIMPSLLIYSNIGKQKWFAASRPTAAKKKAWFVTSRYGWASYYNFRLLVSRKYFLQIPILYEQLHSVYENTTLCNGSNQCQLEGQK